MLIGIVAPSPVPFVMGGAENLWRSLSEAINVQTGHHAEIIKIPVAEQDLFALLAGYEAFCNLDLTHFDVVISGKYPAWMVSHPRHICYMVHRLRGLYDTYVPQPEAELTLERDVRLSEFLKFLEKNVGQNEAVGEVFTRVRDLKDGINADDEVFALPGPLSKRIVRFLDDIALSSESISLHASISANLVEREGYFPSDSTPLVLYPPSHRIARSSPHPRGYFLSVGRLDRPKRVDLLIRAMKLSHTELPLKIVGSGPEESNLRDLVKDDARIQFLGYVNDEETADLYAGARAVLYVPRDEDYGLVTIEAMQSEAPVVTTTDSGGPLEFVKSGKNGVVADPTPESLSHAIEAFSQDSEMAARMGKQARVDIGTVSWGKVLNGLGLAPMPPDEAARLARPKLVVATTFPVFPARGGGQVRVAGLYGQLARHFDIEIISLAPPHAHRSDLEVAPGIIERQIPVTDRHIEAEGRLASEVDWLPISDITFLSLHSLTPDYGEALRIASEGALAVIAEHPYPINAIRDAAPKLPVWYDAHNYELDLKASMLPDSIAARDLLELVRVAEKACWVKSELVFGCSVSDFEKLQTAFGDRSNHISVPNGVDTREIAFVGAKKREIRKRDLGLTDRFVAVFLASWHAPNIDAANFLCDIAGDLPGVTFLIVGGVGDAIDSSNRPPNIAFTGVVDEELKAGILSIADVALNPIESGSGTNLKMLEYAAAGIPILSTKFGARDLEFDHVSEIEVAERSEFVRTLLERSQNPSSETIWRQAERARAAVEERYDWKVISDQFKREIQACGAWPKDSDRP